MVENIQVQKKGEYTCALIAINNVLQEFNQKKIPINTLKIQTKFVESKGNTIYDIHNFFNTYDKVDFSSDIRLKPKIAELRKRQENTSFIVRLSRPDKTGHFVSIVNIGLNDVEVTNYNPIVGIYDKIYKISIKDFKKIYSWVITVKN